MDLLTVIFIAAIWLIVGIIVCRFNGCGDWLIMIADSRNTRRTWLAIPALIVCWILWPISHRIAHAAFLFAIR